MTTTAQPGDFAATGLPMHSDIFAAWLFLQTNNAAQPPTYRNGMTVNLAKSLLDQGERKPEVLSAALVAVMPPDLLPVMRKRLGATCADTVNEFTQHAMTRFAYIDRASPITQKITLAMMCATMTMMQKNGEEMLAELQTLENNGSKDIDINLPMLNDPRSFMLIYDKIMDETGNPQLENNFLDAVLSYKAFREDYLTQLSRLSVLPQRAQVTIKLHLQEPPQIPAFDATGISDTGQLRSIYQQLSRDPRVKPEALTTAIDIASMLSESEECDSTTIAAGLLGTALQHIGPADAPFLRDIAGEDTLALLDESTSSIETMRPLARASLGLRQIAAANAISNLREGESILRDMYSYLSEHERQMSGSEKHTYAAPVVQQVGRVMQGIMTQLQPQISDMPSPILVAALEQQVQQTYNALTSLRRFLTPRSQAPKTDNQQGRSGPSF